MWQKIISFLRKSERIILKAVLKIARFFILIWKKFYGFCQKNGMNCLKNIAYALAILYVIGAVTFGLRLYKQQKTAQIDLWASYIYPFPVANVGRSVLFSHELLYKMNWAKTFAENTQSSISNDLAKRVLDDMVSNAMIMQEASRMGVRISQHEVDKRFQIVISEIGNEERAREYVESYYGMSLSQLERQAVPSILSEEIKSRKLAHVKLRHILIKDEAKAKEVLQKIKDGAKFEDMAKEFSEDTETKENGGLLADGEFIYRGSGLSQDMEDAVFKLSKGQVSDLVKSDMGNHIFLAEDKVDGLDVSFDTWVEKLKDAYRNRTWIKFS